MKFILFVTLFSVLNCFSQTEAFPCKTDEMHQELFLNHPEYIEGIINAHNRLDDDTRNFLSNGDEKSDAAYIIPVVFHIIHNYGPENISDAQIRDALKQVNIQFRKQNADTSEIVTQFKPIAADIEIEFRLAQLDPDGNCTSGITRTVSSLTTPGNHDVKSLIHWPPNKYLNIYVCAQAAGLAGHSMLPAAADTIPEWDGIVMQHSYVGTIGTSEYFRRTVLTHEIGHFLNLQHIWGGNNVPNYYYLPVSDPGNCAYDDEVSDTPNTIGWQSCNLSGTTCGDLDNVQNYMDYAYCGRMFTEGQKARMHACLNSSVANRNNLWQPANLAATGTDDGTYYLCAAKFEADKRVVCVGDTITFSDLSYNGVQTRYWEINGATTNSTTDSIVKAVYSSPGKYTIKLTVGRDGEDVSVTRNEYIQIIPNTSLPNFHIETFEDTTTIKCIILDNDTPTNWEATSSTGYNSTHSFYVNNFEASKGITSDFYFYPVDLSGLTEAVVSFDVAYAQKTSSDNDLLYIYISNDCGNTWSLRKTLSGMSSLKSVSTPVTDSFIPIDENEWKNQTATVNSVNLVNDLIVRFSFKSNGGNNIYIDNIQVADPDELSIHSPENQELLIYPNPSKNNITILATEEVIEHIEIMNLEGKIIYQEEVNTNKVNITSKMESGSYIIRVRTNKGIHQQIHIISN